MSEDDIARLVADFGAAAALAVRCGFEAVQIHAGHGYLLSQFLSPRTNRRSDRYGCGCTADRCRLVLEVSASVRAAVGADVPIVVKANLTDGVAGGAGLTDAVRFAQALERAGDVDLLVASGGWVSLNGFFMLRGPVPLGAMVAALRRKGGRSATLKAAALGVVGRRLVPTLPYVPAFFGSDARVLLAHVRRLQVCLVGGIDSLEALRAALGAGFACVAVARPLLRDREWLHRLKREELQRLKRAESAKRCGATAGAPATPGSATAPLCALCGERTAPPPGPPLCHVCYGAEAIVCSAMAERRLRAGEWPLPRCN